MAELWYYGHMASAIFTSVTRQSTLTERTQSQIEKLIVGGQLQPGDRLPSEKELCARLGVSKTVIREAVRSLAAKGLLDVRAGSGTYVLEMGEEIVSKPISLLLRTHAIQPRHIDEVRQALDVRIAALAAEHARQANIDAMEGAIQKLQAPGLTANEFAAADLEFHHALATASGNPLFSMLSSSLNDVMKEARLWAFQQEGKAMARRAVRCHSRILERVKAKDTKGAAQAVRAHLAR
jgi:GntR family transcriptional repressor for pyruvate dehydrogenase complex